MRWPLASSRQALNSSFFPWQSFWLQSGAASSFVTGGSFSPSCPWSWCQPGTGGCPGGSWPLPSCRKQSSGPLDSQTREFKCSALYIWGVPGRREVCCDNEAARAYGAEPVSIIQSPGNYRGHYACNFRLAEAPQGLALRWRQIVGEQRPRSVSPPAPHTHRPQWLPSSLVSWEVSHLHVIIQVLISTSRMLNFSQQGTFLGLTSRAGKCTGRQLEWVGSPVFSLQLYSSPSWLTVPTLSLFLTFQLSLWWLPHFCPLLSPHHPPLPKKPLGNERRFLGQDWESSKPIQPPWKCHHLWGWHFYLTGFLDWALDPPVCLLFTKGTGLGFSLLSSPKFCLCTWPMRPRKQCDFMIKERNFHCVWFIHSLSLLFTPYCFSQLQFPWQVWPTASYGLRFFRSQVGYEMSSWLGRRGKRWKMKLWLDMIKHSPRAGQMGDWP